MDMNIDMNLHVDTGMDADTDTVCHVEVHQRWSQTLSIDFGDMLSMKRLYGFKKVCLRDAAHCRF